MLLVLVSALAAQSVTASPVQRLYVEPFTTRNGSDQLRNHVIAELKKLNLVQLSGEESSADAVLDGGGEIWIRGYQSLNARSGRLPSDGSPVYDGYLAVELKNRSGQTFWSDLVTPSANTTDIARDLGKRIAKDVAGGLKLAVVAAAPVSPSAPSTTLKGAGATFPQPVYQKWFTNYRRLDPNLDVDYSAVGSEAGVRSLLAGEIDFAGSDSPEAIRDLAPDRQNNYLLFPSVVGAVVPIVNLPGVSTSIKLTSEALAGIYLGKIKKWNDPVLRSANPRIRLPDLDIVVVHRAEGSGTSYALTDFLTRTNAEWKSKVGCGFAPGWPVGRGAAGNEGVAQMVKEYGGAIGYVEFIYALKNHINYGKVQNQNGDYVAASLESMAIAVNEMAKMTNDFKVSIVNAPGAGAYPIASFTWLVVPPAMANAAKRDAMKGLLHWVLGPGQLQAAALGYLALPRDVIIREEKAIDLLH